MLTKEEILKLDDEEVEFYFKREMRQEALAKARQELLNRADVKEAKTIK